MHVSWCRLKSLFPAHHCYMDPLCSLALCLGSCPAEVKQEPHLVSLETKKVLSMLRQHLFSFQADQV